VVLRLLVVSFLSRTDLSMFCPLFSNPETVYGKLEREVAPV